MKTLEFLLFASLSTTCAASYAEGRTLEQCVAAGTAFRDGIISDSFKMALDETRQWQSNEYRNLPLELRMQVMRDIEGNVLYVLSVNEKLKKSIAKWTASGLDGKAKARETIVELWKDAGGSYAAYCIKPTYRLEQLKSSTL